MKSVPEILVEAYRRGRGWDPQFPNLHNLDLGRVAKMTGQEADAKQLVESLQRSDANYSTLVRAIHKRLEPTYDGLVGPATQHLVEIKRCPIPDFAPPPGASFDLGDPELNRVVETQQRYAAATGTGSWPMPGCDPDRQGVHSIRVRINPARMPTVVQAYVQQALAAVVACYADIGLAVRYILDAISDCEIAKLFDALRGGIIGWNEFPQANTCNQTINGRLDTDWAPSDWRLWAGLEQHETGHGVGEQHTNGGPMNPSILLLPITWRNTPSFASLKRKFGGEPINVPGPGPGPGPAPSQRVFLRANAAGSVIDVVARGEFTAKKDEVIDRFRLSPFESV